MNRKYLAELLGTFTLSFIVLEGVAAGAHSPVVVPVIAALTLGLFVYTIGSISGCHMNPAITIGLFTLGQNTKKDTLFYLLFQSAGAIFAILLAKYLLIPMPAAATSMFSLHLFIAEAFGTALFAFGVAPVVKGKVPAVMSGVVVGGSLLLGILVSLLGGSLGILNPAVAIALNAATFTGIWAPVIGSIIGFQLYYYLTK